VVLVALSLALILGCLVSIYLVGRLSGRTTISVKLYGLGFTIKRDATSTFDRDREYLDEGMLDTPLERGEADGLNESNAHEPGDS